MSLGKGIMIIISSCLVVMGVIVTCTSTTKDLCQKTCENYRIVICKKDSVVCEKSELILRKIK